MAAPSASPDVARRRWLRLAVCLGLVLLTWAAYRPVLANDFIDMDDGPYVTANPYVRSGLTWDSVRWAWTTTHAGYWQPLTWLSLQADVSLFGYDARGIHRTNVVLHAATCVTLFLIFARMTGALWRSALLAALFAIHPLHVESVAWAAERKDVLSTFFLVLTLAAYARYAERPGLGWMLITVGLFVLGLMAKPMLVTLPFALLLLDVWPLRRQRSWPALVAEKAVLFVPALAFSAITWALQRESTAAVSLDNVGIGERLATMATGYVWYLEKTVLPTGLAIFYPLRRQVPWGEVVLCAALLLTVTTVLASRWRSHPEWPVGWLWFVGTLLPVSGIAQSGGHAYACRFAYVPHIGLFVTMIWAAAALSARLRLPRRAVMAGAGAVLVLLTLRTRAELAYWQDARSIWERAVAVTGPSYVACGFLGVLHYTAGELALAEERFRQAIDAAPTQANSYYYLGKTLAAANRPADAEEAFRQALERDPTWSEPRLDLAKLLLEQGRPAEAAGVLEAAR